MLFNCPPLPLSPFLGGILTVADDLLKNDGRKFIEMMEQLAERRMAREEDAKDQYGGRAGFAPGLNGAAYGHNHHMPSEEEDYGPEDEDDEEYDSQDEEYDEEEVIFVRLAPAVVLRCPVAQPCPRERAREK